MTQYTETNKSMEALSEFKGLMEGIEAARADALKKLRARSWCQNCGEEDCWKDDYRVDGRLVNWSDVEDVLQ
jgi:hypothetical protein